jgi:hypothetical protein
VEPPVTSPLDWDAWRANYGSMSFAEHQDFYRAVALAYPVQRHYDGRAVLEFLRATHPWTVAEVGGWDGALAEGFLTIVPVVEWTNYEIAPNVPQVCQNSRYRYQPLDRWPWEFEEIPGDALVLSHVVEHMLLDEFAALLDRFYGDAVYIDTPVVGDGRQDWRGYQGSHIIEEGWAGIELRLFSRGFERVTPPGQQRAYRRVP